MSKTFEVTCVNNTWVRGELTQGRVYKVHSVERGQLQEYYIVTNDQGKRGGYYAERFMQIKKKK